MKELILGRYPDNYADLNLMYDLGHEIVNFRPNFDSRDLSNKTLFLSPYLSRTFGFDIQDNKAILGIPEPIFAHFIHMRWYFCAITPNKPGIYLIFAHGVEGYVSHVALKLASRVSRSNLILNYSVLHLVSMNERGEYEMPNENNSFQLTVYQAEKRLWETDIQTDNPTIWSL